MKNKTDIPFFAKDKLSAKETERLIGCSERTARRIINEGSMPSFLDGIIISKWLNLHPEKLIDKDIDQSILAEHEISVLEKEIRSKDLLLNKFRGNEDKYLELFKGLNVYFDIINSGKTAPEFLTDSLSTSIKLILT